MIRSTYSTGLALLASLLFCVTVDAHPVPESDFDRAIVAEVYRDCVIVDYTLEINEFTLLKLVADPDYRVSLKPTGQLNRQDIADAFLRRLETIVPEKLTLSLLIFVRGSPIEPKAPEPRKLSPLSSEVTFGDSAKFSLRFVCRTGLIPANASAKCELIDENFRTKNGRVAIRFEPIQPMTLETRFDFPDERRVGRDPWVAKAELTATRKQTEEDIQSAKATKIYAVHPRIDTDPPSLLDLLIKVYYEDTLTPLLDHSAGLWLVLIVAFAHGMAHSLAPGHGKTLVAAYLVGERGTPRHAVLLGIIVTLTHTATAFAVALALRFVFPNAPPRDVQGVLGVAGGLSIAAIGVWLLVARIGSLRNSTHGHSHGHAHSHSHGEGIGHSHGPTPEQFAKVSTTRLLLLGISGGIIPCWGAVLWVLYCVTAQRPGLAIWTLLAFGTGLAVVLIALGITVSWGTRRIDNRPGLQTLGQWIAIAGACLVAGMGIMISRGNMGLLIPK